MSNTTNPHPSKNTREETLILPKVAHTPETETFESAPFPFLYACMDAKAIFSRYDSILSIISDDEVDEEKAKVLEVKADEERKLFWPKTRNFKDKEEAEDLATKYRTLFTRLYEQWKNKQIDIDELLQSPDLCPLSAKKAFLNT